MTIVTFYMVFFVGSKAYSIVHGLPRAVSFAVIAVLFIARVAALLFITNVLTNMLGIPANIGA